MALEQLWLALFDDHRQPQWPPQVDGDVWRISLTAARTVQDCSHEPPYRISPVFPVSERFSIPKLEGRTLYLSFFCFDPAFPALGRLVQHASDDVLSGLLFALGLASVIHVGERAETASEIERIVGQVPRAKETWEVTDSRISKVTPVLEPPAAVEAAMFRVTPYQSLPLASRTAVDEFVSSMALILPKIALHMPEEIETFRDLVSSVDELVHEMVYVSAPTGPPPPTLSEYRLEDFESDGSLAEMIRQQNTDRLIQINAALSYLSTQALSGAVPILERRSLIRRYSLLGVGTAILALTRISRSIERAFAKGAIETILTERANTAAALPGLEHLPDYDPRDWKQASVDRWKDHVPARRPYPKLAYYSGRLGFREGEYTISAALQALAAGAGPEWSLLTLTHEMLHGHVRNILSILLQGEPQRRPDAKWEEFYERYASHVQRHAPKDETVLDSLRAAILGYCCLTITHGSLTRESDMSRRQDGVEVAANFWLPKRDRLWNVLEMELRNISEILVHVLDLHYFYRSSLRAYVPLIWRSWSPLPQVKGDLRQYLLRTLLVVATGTSGTFYERFRSARGHLLELLEPLLAQRGAGSLTIALAVDILRNEKDAEKLFYPFRASLILVDIAHYVLLSKEIRGSLNVGDRHVGFKTDETDFETSFHYDFPDGFVDDAIVQPTAFLADRLSKKLSYEEADSLEFETVQLFLGCCSHIEPEARRHEGS